MRAPYGAVPAQGTAPERVTTALDWRTAALLGLVTSTWSTIVLSLGANHLGRSIDVDWMIVGTIILRVGGLTAESGPREISAGILVHQTFDFL